MIPAELLRRIRNDLPMAVTIAALGRDGPPSKIRDGRFCFLCPRCAEMLAYVNPRNNLAHCFACHANFNNIDLMRAAGYRFTAAVARLEHWLVRHESRWTPIAKTVVPPCGRSPEFTGIRESPRSGGGIPTAPIRQKMRPQFGPGQVQPAL